MATPRKFSDQLQAFCELADRLATVHEADAMLFLMEQPDGLGAAAAIDGRAHRSAGGRYGGNLGRSGR